MHGCSTLFRVPLTPPITATLNARVEALQVKLAKVEASAAGHRADFERERERARSAHGGAIAGDGRYPSSQGSGGLAPTVSYRPCGRGPWWRRLAG
jgi:hypothetical protein